MCVAACKVPVISWFDDMSDCELLNLIPFFEALADIDDVYAFLGTADKLPPNHADTAPPGLSTNHVDIIPVLLTHADAGDCRLSTADNAVQHE